MTKGFMRANAHTLVFSTQLMTTGGIESHLREFCLHLTKSEIIIDLVVLNSAMTEETEAFYREHCRNVYLGKQGRSAFRFLWLLITIVKLQRYHYNVLYTNGQGNTIKFFASLVPRRSRWVHHHHTAGDPADQATWTRSYRGALKSATTVIGCSRLNAMDIEKAVIRPILSLPCFSRKVIIKRSVAREKLRFGYYGRLIQEKGIDTLCKLSTEDEFKDVEFHIWGEGSGYPDSFFVSFPNVKYHGFFSSANDLSGVISSIDGFLLLSSHPEGLPISLLEAMSAGLPWLATAQGGIPDIALDPTSTRVIPSKSNYQEIKNALLDFCADLKAGKISKTAQLDLYNKKFSSDALTVQWRKVFGL
jgi:glycosyltransferase involved in cell wall biosynthesis